MSRGPLTIDLMSDEVTVRDGENVLARVPTSGTKGGPDAAVSALDEIDRVEGHDVAHLRLHTPWVQVRTLHDLPPVGQRDLVDLVRAQHDRYFRRIGSDVVVAACWTTNESGERVVRAASATLELLELIEARLADAGVELRTIHVVHGGDEPLRLLTERLEVRDRRRARWRRTALVLFALTGWVAAGGVYVGDLLRDDRSTHRALEALSGPLDQLSRVQARMDRFMPVARALARQSDESARLTPVIRAVARTLPDDCHLHELSVERIGRVRLSAHGPDPVAIVRAFSAWWPGSVRIEGSTRTDEAGEMTEFTVVLEMST